MLQQDKASDTGSQTHTQAVVAAMQGLMADADFQEIQFRKQCGWAPLGLVMAALVWACSGAGTLGERFLQALRISGSLGRKYAPTKTSYQAFMKLLVCWTPKLRQSLIRAFQALMKTKFGNLFLLAGFLVLAADGSKLQLTRTQSNEQRYSSQTRGRKGKKRRRVNRARRRARSQPARKQQAKNKKADSPQMALTLLYHVMLRLPWDWRLGPSSDSERDHVKQMLPQLPANALIVGDCGLCGYDFWSELLTSNRNFVMRVGGNVRLLRKLGVVRESKNTVYLWTRSTMKRQQPPLALRLVKVHDGRQPWTLVTSVRDQQRLSDQQVADIYRRRWRIELFFRHFKQTFGKGKLRSHKAEHSECEAQWSLLGLWAMLLHTQILQHQQRPRKRTKDQAPPPCLSVARMLKAFRQSLHESRCRPRKGESLREQLLLAVVDSYRRQNKTSRNYPRKKYERPAKPAQVTNATRSQCKLAQQVMLTAN